MTYFSYDLRFGILKDWLKYLFTFVLVFIACLSCYISFKDSNLNFYDYYVNLFKGEKIFYDGEQRKVYFPYVWFFFTVYILWITGRYPFSEIYNNHGSMVLIYGHSRAKWYISKIAYSIVSVILYFILIFISLVIFCLIFGIKFKIEITPTYNESMPMPASDDISLKTYVLIALLPLFGCIALTLFNLCLSSILGYIKAFTVTVVLTVLSVYTQNYMVFPSGFQLMKLNCFNSGTLNIVTCYVTFAIYMILCIVVGIISFKKSDLLRSSNKIL